MLVCHENSFALQLYDEVVKACSDVHKQGQTIEQLRVGEVVSVGKLLTQKSDNLLLQIAHTRQQGPIA